MILDPFIILIALACGLLSRALGLPALIGYLAAGFVLHETHIEAGALLHNLADLGVTLLLFTIGLKLIPAQLLKPVVWGTTVVHMLLMQLLFAAVLWIAGIAMPGLGLELNELLVIAFALTFSSTVFVIQVMQEKGEMSSHHANLAIGILVIQDLAAVLFLTATKGSLPEIEALLLLLLWPLRRPVTLLMEKAGHGELFTLFGLALALGGAALFEQVGIKGDLGALVIGALLAGTQKSKELYRNLMNFKDLFLVCFFLTIGLDGWPEEEALFLALILGAMALIKPLVYFPLMTWLHAAPRTALLSASALGNYSEFGLVVIAVAAKSGWVAPEWASTVSLAIAASFLLSSPLSKRAHELYRRGHDFWLRFESEQVSAARPDTSNARIIVLGMGNIGKGAYDAIAEKHGREVLGVDLNDRKLMEHTRKHRRVVTADASDPDFWHQVDLGEVTLILLALTHHEENILVAELLRDLGYKGQTAAVVRFAEEARDLEKHGFTAFNLYAQAGAGFADHAVQQLEKSES
ncbi:cation:proton antiporter family protein [Pseudohalioglobus lutimaris]|uniref:cation:proton antiporter family protein n=1 Tax=Pseudohalioglobus lutimaris TaxID=1737061 RepID=UPI001FAEA777|nr:cation:proton antiporter family protein [Pseudohalioglobus lutimaris]